jgi:hypothetical protein
MEPANQGCGDLHIAARIPADAKRLIKPNVKAGGFAGLDPKSDGVRRNLPLSRVCPCGEGDSSACLPPLTNLGRYPTGGKRTGAPEDSRGRKPLSKAFEGPYNIVGRYAGPRRTGLVRTRPAPCRASGTLAMADLRSGTTQLVLPTLEKPGVPKDRFLDSVRRAAAGEFEILGELGRRADGGIAYLARDLAEPRLVALRLERTPGGPHHYALDVLKELDATLPTTGDGCPRCSAPPRGWGRFCPACGLDLSGGSGSRTGLPSGELLQAAREAAGAQYQILGEMKRAEGGGKVYFARERGKQTIVGLRLTEGPSRSYSVDRTAVLPLLPDPTEGAGEASPSPPPTGREGVRPADDARKGGSPEETRKDIRAPGNGGLDHPGRPGTRRPGMLSNVPWGMVLLVAAAAAIFVLVLIALLR